MSAAQQAPEWLAIAMTPSDTPHCHATLWSMSESQVLQRHDHQVQQADPQTGLLALLHSYAAQDPAAKARPVFISGSGLAAPAMVPANPAELPTSTLVLDGWQLQLVPGLQQTAPTALMQGPETQISGFLARNPKWDGVICLPGLTTHWAQVSADEVVSFQSFLTAQLFGALCQNETSNWSLSALQDATADTMSRPERLASRLAELAVHTQRNSKDSAELSGLLWGYLIGAELAAARPYWLGQNLTLIGADVHAAPYAAALEAQGLPVTRAQVPPMALAGLIQARRVHRKQTTPR